MPDSRFLRILAALLLSAFLLAGCGEVTLTVAETGEQQTYARDTEALAAVLTAEELPALNKLKKLRALDLSGSSCYAEILAWAAAHPRVAVRYTVPLPDGRVIPNDQTALDCSSLRRDEVAALAESLRWLPAVEAVSLGGTGDNDLLPADLELLRAGCPQVAFSYTPRFHGEAISADSTFLDFHDATADELRELLPWLSTLTALEAVSLGGTGDNDLLPADLELLRAGCPQVTFSYTLRYRGEAISANSTILDFHDAQADELRGLLPWLPTLTAVQRVELGEGGDAADPRLPWELVQALVSAFPRAAFDYSFQLYGRALDLSCESLDLNHITMEDQGALVKAITVCMPKLCWLDMDFCGVDDEHMAEIRDALPNAEVVWRIWFGKGYSVRTDVTMILASNPDKAGELTPENTVSLKYCTKVKYLDLGHNSYLGTLDYCAYMPDLEVLIVAMGNFSDITPLLNCPKLEYAELQTSSLNDLRPLAGMKNLRHLNICYCFALHDITPLYGLDLERLWIGCLTPIPSEQVAEFQRLNPDCTVDLESVDPTQTYWRYIGADEFGHLIRDPRYILLREQFRYDEAPFCYSYIENDPLYHRHG